MPYIKKLDREKLETDLVKFIDTLIELEKDQGISSLKGIINYSFTKILKSVYAQEKGKNSLSYSNVNDAIGILECIKMELYREVAVPYEEVKKRENGDVYPAPVNREILLQDIWESQECE